MKSGRTTQLLSWFQQSEGRDEAPGKVCWSRGGDIPADPRQEERKGEAAARRSLWQGTESPALGDTAENTMTITMTMTTRKSGCCNTCK